MPRAADGVALDVEWSVLEYPASTTTTCKDPDCTHTVSAYTATDITTTTLTYPMPTPFDYGKPDYQVPLIGDDVDEGDFNIPPVTVTVLNTSTAHPICYSHPDGAYRVC